MLKGIIYAVLGVMAIITLVIYLGLIPEEVKRLYEKWKTRG